MTSNPGYGQETTGTEVGERFAKQIKGKTGIVKLMSC